MKATKARVFVFLTLVILTAVFSANALTANATAATTDTAASQQSGFIASSFNNILSFFGLAEAAKPAADKTDRSGCDTAPEGLLACYRGDLDATDVKGVHNGEWVGVYGYATGKVGAGAFNFNGTSRVEVANAPDLNPENVTVDGWVNLSSAEGTFGLIGKGDAYSLSVRGGNVVFTSRNAEGVIETLEGPSIKLGTWTHIAATHDGSMRRLYVDGKEVASRAQSGLFVADESKLAIGATTTTDAAFAGMADEVKVFGRALSAKEIEDIAGDRPDAPDAAISFTAGATLTVTEGDAGQQNVSINFTRAAGGGAGNMTVLLTPGTAVYGASSACGVGDDVVVQPNPVTIVWNANETVKSFGVDICGDTVPEPQENFTLTIQTVPAGDSGVGNALTVNINDQDATVTIPTVAGSPASSAGPNATEENPGFLFYTFTRAPGAPVNFDLGVNFTRSGTADDGDDGTTGGDDFNIDTAGTCTNETYTDATNSGSLTIPSGSTSCTLRVVPLVDSRVEPNETVVLTLAAGSYTIGAPSVGTGIIQNDDFAVVRLNTDPTESSEGNPGGAGTLTYDFERSVPANSQQETLNVRFEVTGTAACGGANPDYTVTVSGANRVTAFACTGANTGRGIMQFQNAELDPNNLPVINIVSDSRVEPDETAIVSILAFNAATVAGDPFTGPNDNSNTYGTVGFPGGDDTSDTGIIDDDDETITVTSANSPLSEAGPGGLQFNVVRNFNSVGGAAPDNDPAVTDVLTVNFSISSLAPTATQANCTGSDFTVSSGSNEVVTYNPVNCTGTIAFPAGGDVNGQILVTPVNDNLPENNESLTLTITANTLGAANNYGIGPVIGPDGAVSGTATADAQILNDDLQVIVAVSPASVPEGSPSAPNATNLIYTFTRIGETNNPTCANFNATGVGASALSDYTTSFGAATVAPCTNSFTATAGVSPGSIGIPAGAGNPDNIGGVQANQATFIVNPTDDATVEPDEEVQIQVDNHTGIGQFYTPGNPAQASGLILNDDAEVSVAVAPGAVLEDGVANLVYTFSRTGGCGAALTINYNNSNAGTAASGSDYPTPASGANTATFAAGQCTTSVTVDPNTDSTVEPDETVIFTVTAGTGYTVAAAPADSATGTIQNDDSGVSVAVAPASVNEDSGTNLVYTFTRTGVTNTPITVTYTVTGTASNGTDYTAIGVSVPFAVNQTTATVNVTPTADTVVEPDETVIITVTDGSGYSAAGAPATGTITNDDADIVCSGPVPASVNENSGTAMVYSCTRTGLTAPALTVPFTLSGTASAGDYTVGGNTSGVVNAVGGNLNFGAGLATATVTVTPVADLTPETDETVIVTFTNPGVYSGYDFVPSPTALTGTITNDDQDVSVAVAPASVTENGVPNLVYTFTRVPGSAALAALPLTVNFTTTGTATSGDDYTQTSTGTVTFAGGSNTVTVTVDPTPDSVVEPDETVILTVTAGAGYAVVAPASATGTILNDDTSYTIQFIGVTGAASGAGKEGNPADAGETIATFRVFRNGANSLAGNVDVSTVPGSGTAVGGAPNTTCQPGQDYTADGRTIVFAAGGDASEDFTVRICRDLVFELTETFDAQLTNPTAGFLGAPAVATATILDDDAAPTLSINSISVNENAGTATLTVTQSIATALNTTFSFSTGAMGDTATANVDYTSTASTGSIPAGSTTASIIIPIIDDNIDEPNETFVVTLSAPVNATINVGTGTVTILDNEPNTQFAINNVVQIEGNPSAQDPTVASTSAFNFRITRTGDAQASETVCFETVDGDIENPAVNPNPAIGGPGGTIPSNVGTPDYTHRPAGPNNCVTFTQGGPSVITVPVIVYGDVVAEFDESFTVRILTVNGVANPLDQNNNPRVTDGLGLGVIQNDDGAPSISLSVNGPLQEGNTPSTGGSFTFTVTRTGSTSNPVTANWATSTGSGTSAATAGASCALDNAVDFITSSGQVTIPANSSSATFTVNYCGDLYDELNESFTATLSNPSNGVIGTASATATINDDDAAPIISVSDVSVCEPDSGTAAAVFTITRTGPSYLTSTVNVNTVDGTATTTDNDYVGILTPGGQQFTFNPTVTTLTVPVTVNGDTKFETDETFTLQIVGSSSDVVVNPIGGADPIGLGVIVNSGAGCTGDAAPSFALGPVTQNEGNGAAGTSAPFYVRLTRTGTTQVPTVITYSTSTSGGTATGGSSCTAGVDFINVSNATVAFAANGFPAAVGPPASGANFIDLPIQVCQDATFEPNETFNVVINSAGGAGVINPTGSPALVTIVNDDGLAFAVRFPGPEGAEGNVGNTAFTFTIDRIGDSSVASNVCYQTVAGTATEGVDYIGLTPGAANCVNFTAGTMSANVAVTVVGDTTPELDETFFLRLISATAGTIPVSPAGDRVATINNDDGPIPVPTGFEGDIVDGSGGAAGDNLVLANDVSAIRQFVLNGTGWVTTPNQFQRADVNLPCGNGQIDSGDVTVIRAILLNSTALVAACGPTIVGGVAPIEAERGSSPEVVGRIIRAVSTTTTAGQTVAVSFQLDSQGDEASASYTINWNPAVFTYVSSAVGSGVPSNTNLGTNTSQTAAGRLGVLLDSTNTYAAGTRQILTVTFTVAANAAAGTYPVTFSSTPTAQSVSNAQGALLATTYEAGNIVIGPTAAGVRVSGRVTTAGGQALRNATVILTDSEGNRRTVTTGSFGIYAFEDVEAGQTYVVGVSAKRYRFASRVVNVTDSLADVDFVGQE